MYLTLFRSLYCRVVDDGVRPSEPNKDTWNMYSLMCIYVHKLTRYKCFFGIPSRFVCDLFPRKLLPRKNSQRRGFLERSVRRTNCSGMYFLLAGVALFKYIKTVLWQVNDPDTEGPPVDEAPWHCINQHLFWVKYPRDPMIFLRFWGKSCKNI